MDDLIETTDNSDDVVTETGDNESTTNTNDTSETADTSSDNQNGSTSITILESVKKMLSIDSEVTEFDIDIIAKINSAFFSIYQLGVGPSTPFRINTTTTWDELETSIPKDVVLEYLYLKTRLVFDPPTIASVIDAYKSSISELEFRMNVEVDSGGGVISG